MIEVRLKLQPSGEPRRLDDLLWGGSKPVEFAGMACWLDGTGAVAAENGGLIGTNGKTYLFKPVCYKSPSWMVPRRFDDRDHFHLADKHRVTTFPESLPVSMTRLKRLGSPAEVEEVLKLQGCDRFRLVEGVKVPLEGSAPTVDRQTAEQYAEGIERDRLKMYLSELGEQRATALIDSIRFEVEYANGERLYLAGFEVVAWRSVDVEFVEKVRESIEREGTRKVVVPDSSTIHPQKPGKGQPRTKKQIEADRAKRKMPPALEQRAVREIKKLMAGEKSLNDAVSLVIRRMGQPTTNGYGWDTPAEQIPSAKTLKRAYQKSTKKKPKT